MVNTTGQILINVVLANAGLTFQDKGLGSIFFLTYLNSLVRRMVWHGGEPYNPSDHQVTFLDAENGGSNNQKRADSKMARIHFVESEKEVTDPRTPEQQ